MKVPGKIPKKAVKPLMEYCKKLGEETGKPPAEVFKEHLELMNKHADYFFSDPWPEKLDRKFRFSYEDMEFLEGAESYEEEWDRFTLACLRRNISMEGFNSLGFTQDNRFHGGHWCFKCSVCRAMELRRQAKLIEDDMREIEEKMKCENPSLSTRKRYEHNKRPDVVRRHKMLFVELKFYEEKGKAKGKSCNVKDEFKCPYGRKSEKLIEKGWVIYTVWQHIHWYDCFENKPSIIDVTSYEDVLKALGDGRWEKIEKEHKKYIRKLDAKHRSSSYRCKL